MPLSVLIPFRSDDGWRDALLNWTIRWWQVNFPAVEIVVADTDHELFNRGAARNEAARHATGDVLVIADADTIPQADAVRASVELVASGEAPWVIPYDGAPDGRYYNLSESATRRRLRFAPDPATPIGEPWDPDDIEFKLVSWAGCLIVPAEGFWKAGGYPELELWGYEDDCARTAFDVMVGPHVRVPGFAVHLWHECSNSDRFDNPGIAGNRAVYDEYRSARSPQRMAQVIDRHGSKRERRRSEVR